MKQPEAVGHDAVHAEVEEPLDGGLVVDRPHVHGQVRAMRGRDESLRDDRDRSSMRRHLQAIGAEARHQPERRGGTAQCDGARSHGRARPPTTKFTDPPQAAVRERSDAHAIPRVQPVEERRERYDAGVGLGVDVDSCLGPPDEEVLEPRDADSLTAKREGASAVG